MTKSCIIILINNPPYIIYFFVVHEEVIIVYRIGMDRESSMKALYFHLILFSTLREKKMGNHYWAGLGWAGGLLSRSSHPKIKLEKRKMRRCLIKNSFVDGQYFWS